MEPLICDQCGRPILMPDQIGYDGPVDRKCEECHPFVGWIVICKKCEDTNEGRGLLSSQDSRA